MNEVELGKTVQRHGVDGGTRCDALDLAGDLFGNDAVATHIANECGNAFDHYELVAHAAN